MLDFIKNIFGKKSGKPSSKKMAIKLKYDEKMSIQKNCEGAKIWKGKVASIDENSFTIEVPEISGISPLPVSENEGVCVTIPRDDNKFAKFKTIILSISQKSRSPMLELENPDVVQYEEVKKRQHVRIKTNLPAKVQLERKYGEEWTSVRLLDFSLTGLSFETDRIINEKETVRIKIMSMQYPLTVAGIAVRINKIDGCGDGKDKFQVAMQFIDVSNMDRELLTNLVAFLQRMKS